MKIPAINWEYLENHFNKKKEKPVSRICKELFQLNKKIHAPIKNGQKIKHMINKLQIGTQEDNYYWNTESSMRYHCIPFRMAKK